MFLKKAKHPSTEAEASRLMLIIIASRNIATTADLIAAGCL